jgi:MFS family permease
MQLHSAPGRGGHVDMQQSSSLLRRAPAGLVVMLSLALMLNYIDRGAIATAAPLLQDELKLSPSEIGWVLAGPRVTGRWLGIQNAVGNVAGMTAPVVAGYLVESTGNYTSASIVSGAVALCGLVAWLVVVPEVKPIDWKAERQRLCPGAAVG